jgi:hypothetical protein
VASPRAWWRRLRRVAAVTALTLPLLASGPCVQLSRSAAIDGFFNALTTVLVDQLAQRLGLTAGTTTTADQSDATAGL